MKLAKALSIKGAVLDKNQLENYLEKIASDHVLQDNSDKDTYPIPRLKENFEFITKTYDMLTSNLKIGLDIHPAGEWLLDNYYIIEETYQAIKKDLTLQKYTNLVGLSAGSYKGYARIYVLASEIVAYTDAKIDMHTLSAFLKAYQNKKTLNMEEIWNISTFFKIAIIENIKTVCEKIESSQKQKYKAENMIERLVENKQKENQKFQMTPEYKTKIQSVGEMKYPFIEHMSYRLKKYGKRASSHLEILEEQIHKLGTSISEVIRKEHFDIALKKVSMGNCIKSIKELQTINILEIFEEINGVEEILKQDPARIYEGMDYKTKDYYRSKIKQISKKNRISEIYVAKKALELANIEKQKNEIGKEKKMHIGYYLISEGIYKLNNSIQVKNNTKVKTKSYEQKRQDKVKAYIGIVTVISVFLSILTGVYVYNKTNNILLSIIETILIFLPITEITTQIVQNLLNKIVKPKLIPKMDFNRGVPKEDTTAIILPTIVGDKKRVKELMKKLEVFYLANKSENLYFILLADCTSSSKKDEVFDKEVIQEGIKQVEILNKKYENTGLGKFQFIYRQRTWNEKETSFLGWERKRGMIAQFNEYIIKKVNQKSKDKFDYGPSFKENTIQTWIDKNGSSNLPNIKYVITLDADTDLVLNSGLELIGAMSHILNRPNLNKEKTTVIDGHALMQPRVGVDLLASRKSKFSEIFAGLGGTDSYTNAISDIYQDNFGEGIFTGKGIYDLEVFSKVLKNAIPQNTVLSHDLLEGNYLRCALVTDIQLMDGYPYKYASFILRLHRWIRGDWQIIRWTKNYIKDANGNVIKNPLNLLSKFKILDNLKRSMIEIAVILNFILLAVLMKFNLNLPITLILSICFGGVLIPTILELLGHMIYRKEGQHQQKRFEKSTSELCGSILRGIICIAVLPHKAYISCNAIVKTIYRLEVSKKNLLEWTTSEEAEKKAKTTILSYYQQMFANVILGIVAILGVIYYSIFQVRLLFAILAILWFLAPLVMCYISKENNKIEKIKLLEKEEGEYVKEIGKKTWSFFEDYITKENNFLPPDNLQEGRKPRVVKRTSSTNIGLGLLCVVSAYDLGYIDLNKAMTLLENMIDTIEKLQKWNGHLYNWYNTSTLEPLNPRYISTVDSGNFIGYLYTLKQFLIYVETNEKIHSKLDKKFSKEKIQNLIQDIDKIIVNTDFSVLYNNEKRLFSIGYDLEENKLTDSYYDLLASEARQASLIAIAKKDVSSKHWNNLSRTLTSLDGYKGLISWSGTAFEYLMPNVNIRKYPGSLLDESSKFMIMSQEKYAKRLGIPWGISESAFNLKDLSYNYQYKAFGIPWLGLKRGLADDMVVSSYGSILAITEEPKKVVNNIKELEKQGMYGKYGFYESIDYTPARLPNGKENMVVKTYMAHHQALILLSINNLFNNNILQERFMENPEIKAIDILLQERMPQNVVMTKQKKEKVEKIKYKGYDNYIQRTYNEINNDSICSNVISNEDYTVVINGKGEGFSKYKNIFINRYKQTNDYPQGIFFYIKNIKSKRIWTSNINNNISKSDKYQIDFYPDKSQFTRRDEDIETVTKIITSPQDPVEIRSVELTNNGTVEQILEVTSVLEPVLSAKEQDYAHMAFNNLFLKYDILEDTNSILVKRNKRGNTKEIFLGANLYTQGETVGELEYEIDKEKLYENSGMYIPKMIEHSHPFSKNIGLVTYPVIALKRTIKIKPKETAKLNLVLCVSEEKEKINEIMKKYENSENIQRAFELSKVRVEEEARYLGMTKNAIKNSQTLLSYIIFGNNAKKLYLNNIKDKNYFQSDLWRYGISGDLPILLVKIKEISDVYVVSEVIRAYEYARSKNIYMDLVILLQEEKKQEVYITEAIKKELVNRYLTYLENTNGGIFIINEKELEDKDLLEFKAEFVIDTAKGNLENILKETSDEYLESIPKSKIEKTKPKVIENPDKAGATIKLEDLKYNNEYGAFSEDGKEYIIKVNKDRDLPTVWSHVLANKNFGTLVTNNMGGFTWSKNSRLNRLTAWSNNTIFDVPSEIIYIKDKENGNSWSLGAKPMPDENDYYITYGFGYAKYYHSSYGIIQEAKVFVPKEDKVRVNIVTLKNTMQNKRNLKLVYYLKPVLGEDEIKTDGYLDMQYDENSNLITVKNRYSNKTAGTLYVSCSEKIKSFTGSKRDFIGEGTISNPEGLNKESLLGENSLGQSSCIAIEIELELNPYESKELAFILGEEENKADIRIKKDKYVKLNNCMSELENVKQYWNETLRKVQVKTPVESTDIILNGWLVYQTIACRMWARSAFYQSGGAFGFRDQLQDTLGLKFINPEFMKEQIIKHSMHQFIEGDVEHWWHDETNKGIRTRFSDDLLWLVYVTIEYIEFTKDKSILDIQTPYVTGEVLKEGQDEIYDTHVQSEEKESIYKHCIRAIEKSLQFGENGLPKIGSGDWNDGFSEVGNKGTGESIWLGFFLYVILEKWIPICMEKGDKELAVKYEDIIQKLKKALNTNGWDGRWYKRAYTDDGNILRKYGK